MTDLIPYLWLVLKIVLIVVAVLFFISGLDDLFIDVYYGLRAIYRRLFILPKYSPLTEAQLLEPTEQAIAVMIPAWQEGAVIRRMLENTVQTFKYTNYHIFVGTYPNDPDTWREVELVREKYDHVHRIVCPKDGPTNKADCLNWVYQGIRTFEHDNNMEFAIFVMEDAEDIVHPLALKLFNYLVPRKDMVQIPVLTYECGWFDFTRGHYLDEFAENHFKNLIVREFFARHVPSAGTGCAFSRRAFDAAAEHDQNLLFSIHSLTEDYEIGLRLARYGFKTIFVKQAFKRDVYRKSFLRKVPQKKIIKDYISVREYFPKEFRAAVRQKARWVLGIALQGWVHLGWRGGLRTKYMLYRDRKTLLTSLVNMLGYFVVLGILTYWFITWHFPESYHYPPLVSSNTTLYYLILADTLFMLVRLGERFFCVQHFYGWIQAFLSIPRFVWGNIINFAATTRAIYLFGRYLCTGKLIAWDKTDHVLPTEQELRRYRHKLGDLLLEKKFLSVRELNRALEEQKKKKLPLGTLLVRMGLVKEDDLIHVLGLQLQLQTQEIDPFAVPLEVIQALPRHLAIQFSIFPLEVTDTKLVVAAHNILSQEDLEVIRQQIGRRVELRLATQSDLSFAIRMGYQRLQLPVDDRPSVSDPAEVLRQCNVVPLDILQLALKLQRRSYMRLGDILVQQGELGFETLAKALAEYTRNPEMRLGDFLIIHNYLDNDQLQKALAIQKAELLMLGDVLYKMGAIGGFLRDILNAACNGLLTPMQVEEIIRLTPAEATVPIQAQALHDLLSLAENQKIPSSVLPTFLAMICSGEIGTDTLEKIIEGLQHGTVGASTLLEELGNIRSGGITPHKSDRFDANN